MKKILFFILCYFCIIFSVNATLGYIYSKTSPNAFILGLDQKFHLSLLASIHMMKAEVTGFI